MNPQRPKVRGPQRVDSVPFHTGSGEDDVTRPWLGDSEPEVRPWIPVGLPAGTTLYGEPYEPTADPLEDAEPQPCPLCAETEREADARVEQLRAPYLEATRGVKQAADGMSRDYAHGVVKLASRMAATILERQAETDETLLEKTLQEVLETVGPVVALSIDAHPDDVAALREMAPDMAEELSGRPVDVAVSPSQDVPRGTCICHFDRGIVDGRWSTRLRHLEDAVVNALDHGEVEA